MLEERLYSMQLRRLQKRQRTVSIENDRKVNDARKNKKDDELVRAAEYEAWCEDQEFEGLIQQLQTRHLIRLAGRYLLPYPEQDEWEEEKGPFYYRHLKRGASARLRSAIRLEKKERWESWYRWVPLVTGLTGLFGTLIGLIVAIAKWL
jgi:hypothetical protein